MGELITQAAQELRQRQTEAENLLWSRLRRNHLNGAKFRRQEPIGSFIVDFVSYEKKLIIEIDGGQHKRKEAKWNDVQRTEWLESQEFKVLRFWNHEVSNHFEKVIEKIRNNLNIYPHPDPLP